MKAIFSNLESLEQLEHLFEISKERPVVLFKHSTSCPISASAYREISNADVDVNLIIVQTSPDISKAIAERTGIRHQSPQVIILKDNEVIYQKSHHGITAEDITEIAER